MDIAIMNHELRSHYLQTINGMIIPSFYGDNGDIINWIIMRNILPMEIEVSLTYPTDISVISHSKSVLTTLTITLENAEFNFFNEFKAIGNIPCLTSLDYGKINNFYQLSSFVIKNPQLQRLSLTVDNPLGLPETLKIQNFPSLRELDLSLNSWLKDRYVNDLVKGKLNLLSLNISYTSITRIQSIRSILEGFPNLCFLDFSGSCVQEINDVIQLLFQRVKESLAIDDPEIQQRALECLHHTVLYYSVTL